MSRTNLIRLLTSQLTKTQSEPTTRCVRFVTSSTQHQHQEQEHEKKQLEEEAANAKNLDSKQQEDAANDDEEEEGEYVNKETGEIGGPRGPEPTRYGDWERGGRCSDF